MNLLLTAQTKTRDRTAQDAQAHPYTSLSSTVQGQTTALRDHHPEQPRWGLVRGQ
jgi:hypothetical protein